MKKVKISNPIPHVVRAVKQKINKAKEDKDQKKEDMKTVQRIQDLNKDSDQDIWSV